MKTVPESFDAAPVRPITPPRPLPQFESVEDWFNFYRNTEADTRTENLQRWSDSFWKYEAERRFTEMALKQTVDRLREKRYQMGVVWSILTPEGKPLSPDQKSHLEPYGDGLTRHCLVEYLAKLDSETLINCFAAVLHEKKSYEAAKVTTRLAHQFAPKGVSHD